jgi:predicted nucleic acid-binding protein
VSGFVLDCSVAMGWCFEDESDALTSLVLERLLSEPGIVPELWVLEVANVLLVAERRGRIRRAESTRFIELLQGLPIRVERGHASLADSQGILALGRDFALSSYDAAYLELSMRHGVPLATKDEKLRAACDAAGVALI